jgi:hypothetical protein
MIKNPEAETPYRKNQMKLVFEIMSDGQTHSKFEIADKLKIDSSSVASRIRDLRLNKNGAWNIVMVSLCNYQLLPGRYVNVDKRQKETEYKYTYEKGLLFQTENEKRS